MSRPRFWLTFWHVSVEAYIVVVVTLILILPGRFG